MNVLITGTGRGIGLGFVEYYLMHDHTVYACYRTESLKLATLAGRYNDLNLLQWDVTRPVSDSLLQSLPNHIDLIINNAGIYGPKKDSQSLLKITPEAMHEVYDVDCVAPLGVVQTLQEKLSRPGGIIANISSKMGSSGDNTSGGTYAYRAARAALVIISKSMAVDLQPEGISVITLHPGWVRTEMTGFTGLIDVSESVAGMASIIENIDNYEPGAFVAFDGQIVPY
ncbi:C-factor [bacterium BMS3Bbin11]|nr:C-factor [bacterium BMS3Bbin11]GMT40516.1 MAG: oxidoreductase [bacterium]HDH09166.1 SDR family NAD(P)-dependent oxidoreductase [Gammaproteobacteria bacterium]